MKQNYTVHPGDTIEKIAKKLQLNNRELTAIIERNNIKNPDLIRAGDILIIPEKITAEAKGEKIVESTSKTTVPESGYGVIIREGQIQEILPSAKKENIKKFTQALDTELLRFKINTPLRVAQFIAQVAVESASFNLTEEDLNYSADRLRKIFSKYFPTKTLAEQYAHKPEKIANRVYANRIGNGDEKSGDGWRYRGRGLIQLTGKENYIACGKAIEQPLQMKPDIVSTDPYIAVMTCCWYWNSKDLNRYADQDNVKTITKKINGGYHGLDQRKAFLNKAKKIFGVS
ncbi:Glycoside hydrolase [Candidatus Electrothrix laxa]